MSFKFEKLIIWQKAMFLGEEVFNVSKSFPKNEIYNLTSQINRAVDFIALNISEGSIEQSTPEFKRFLNYSIRSTAEVVTCLIKAKSRNYINEEVFDKLYNDFYNLMNMIIGFKNQLKS
jgi:four helix bundle protein